jgi:hypothetical protein
MESLGRLFFEDSLYVYITLAFAELVIGAIWHETRSRRWLVALAGPPILAGIVLAVSAWVVTDREKIIEATRAIARDAEAGSLAVAETYLDDDYDGLGFSKAGVLAIGKAVLNAHRVKRVGFTRVTVEVTGASATMHLGTIITLAEGGKVTLIWDVRWVKRPGGWRILHLAEPQSRLEL